MCCVLERLSPDHGPQVMAIFNHYVQDGFAAYFETPLPDAAFGRIVEMAKGYPAYVVKGEDGEVLGFGFLHAWHPAPAFRETAEVSYFIRPGHTRAGLGARLLDRLIGDARQAGIACLLASISSLNEPSLRFHRKQGFVECGRFAGIGRKRGQAFDVIWMQKKL